MSPCFRNEETTRDIPALPGTIEPVAARKILRFGCFQDFQLFLLTSHMFEDRSFKSVLVSLNHLGKNNIVDMEVLNRVPVPCLINSPWSESKERTLFCDNIRISTNNNKIMCSATVQGELYFCFVGKNNLMQPNENRLIKTMKTLFLSLNLGKEGLICTYSFYS